MKTIQSYLASVALATLVLLNFACSDDPSPIAGEPDLSLVEDEFVINSSFEDLDFLLLDVIQTSGLGLRTTQTTELCEGSSIDHDTATKTIIVDFGAGCTSSNGVTRKGKIILNYTGTNFLFPGASVTTTFQGYEVNGIKIEGTRSLTNAGIDLINSKVSLKVKITNGKITWPDNTFVTYTTDQTRVVSLASSGYEASVTGTASGTSRDNKSYTATIIDALIVKEDCVNTGVYVPSSGTMTYSYGTTTVGVDYGGGTCDKVITITYPGGSKEITLD